MLVKMNIVKVTLPVSNHHLKWINQSRTSLVRLHHLRSTMNKFHSKINSSNSFKVDSTRRAYPSLISSLYPINNSSWILHSNNSLCKVSNSTSHHQPVFHSLQTIKLSTCWAKINSSVILMLRIYLVYSHSRLTMLLNNKLCFFNSIRTINSSNNYKFWTRQQELITNCLWITNCL